MSPTHVAYQSMSPTLVAYHRAIGEASDLIAYARKVGQRCLLGPGVRDLLRLMRAEQRMA
jgi:hypothetical protein